MQDPKKAVNQVIESTLKGHSDNLQNLKLQAGQQNQILNEYRHGIYNMELRFELLVKMMEEKGVLAKGEFQKRWPLFLKNDVGAVGPNGIMEGTLKVTFYNMGA